MRIDDAIRVVRGAWYCEYGLVQRCMYAVPTVVLAPVPLTPSLPAQRLLSRPLP
jgi:hypothetical protein